MESSRQALTIALLLATILGAGVQLTIAQNSPQDYVNAHTSARRTVGVGPVRWDPRLASYAQNYTNQQTGNCQSMQHSGGPYGENIFWGRGRAYTAHDAVDKWMSEKQYYNYPRNSCARGRTCEHYTQVVWKNSTRMGCSRKMCSGRAIYMICEYAPKGNIRGQRPY